MKPLVYQTEIEGEIISIFWQDIWKIVFSIEQTYHCGESLGFHSFYSFGDYFRKTLQKLDHLYHLEQTKIPPSAISWSFTQRVAQKLKTLKAQTLSYEQ